MKNKWTGWWETGPIMVNFVISKLNLVTYDLHMVWYRLFDHAIQDNIMVWVWHETRGRMWYKQGVTMLSFSRYASRKKIMLFKKKKETKRFVFAFEIHMLISMISIDLPVPESRLRTSPTNCQCKTRKLCVWPLRLMRCCLLYLRSLRNFLAYSKFYHAKLSKVLYAWHGNILYGCKPIKWLHSSLLNNNFMFVAHNSPESNLSCYQYVKLETMNLALGHIGPYMMWLNYFYNPRVTYKFRCVCHRHTYRCMLNTHIKKEIACFLCSNSWQKTWTTEYKLHTLCLETTGE